MDLAKYRQLFVDEASDHLAEMGRALSALETGDDESAEAVDTLFRMTHSIKGMAASLDYHSVSALAHKLEDWLEPMRKTGTIPERALGLVYDAVRAMEEMVAIVERSGEAPPPRNDLLRRFAAPPEPTAEQEREPRVQEVREPAKKPATSARRPCLAASACGPRPSIASSHP